MKKLYVIFHRIPHRAKEYLFTTIIFLFILLISAIPDYIYYHTRLWQSKNSFGTFCTFIKKRGFSYTEALGTLKSHFGIFITAISVIITMSVNNLNRSENKFFGLTRKQFDFSKRQVIYQHGRRMILFTPLVMIVAVNIGYCITGYAVLALSYLFVIIAYLMFESSFSKEKDLNCIARKLLETIPQIVSNAEDLTEYLMLLNIMRQWNKKEKYWEGVNYLFRMIESQARKYDVKKRYILCQCFYKAMYILDNKKDCERAICALKDYIIRKDREGWEQADYVILWGIMHCLLQECARKEAVHFIKWYLDFSLRSRKTISIYKHEQNKESFCMIDMRDRCRQTGILLVEIELYFHSHKKIDNYIWEKLSQIWYEGRCFLSDSEKMLRKQYLEINTMYDFFDTSVIENRLKNLCEDYYYNTKKSLVVYYVKYKEEHDGDSM